MPTAPWGVCRSTGDHRRLVGPHFLAGRPRCIGVRAARCVFQSGPDRVALDSWAHRWRRYGLTQPRISEGRSGDLAQPAARGMAGYARYASYVDADRREDSAGPGAEAKPLVACSPVRERARVDDDADPIRPPRIRGGV